MKLQVRLNAAEPVDLELPALVPGNPVTAVFDGAEHEVELVSTNPGEVVLKIDGHRYQLSFERLQSAPGSGTSLLISHRNRAYRLDVTSELDRLQGSALSARQRSEPSTLLSQLPGVIRQIFVEVGARVEVDQPLLTLEAMKMENEIRADIAGRIDAILVESGRVVAAREALVRIVPE